MNDFLLLAAIFLYPYTSIYDSLFDTRTSSDNFLIFITFKLFDVLELKTTLVHKFALLTIKDPNIIDNTIIFIFH